jgi:hypothetical protein
MRIAQWFTAACAVIILTAAVVCLGPLYQLRVGTIFVSVVKPAGLWTAGLAAALLVSQQDRADRQRRPWRNLAVGLLLSAAAQSVLAYHQVFLHIAAPFPSPADPLFVLGAFFLLAAMVEFALVAKTSGLALGSNLAFWWPALVVIVVFVPAVLPALRAVFAAGGPPVELALNVFYPTASFLTLVPLMTLMRVGWLFRGGRLLWVWTPLTLGFACVLFSDVLFAYSSTLHVSYLDRPLDFMYLCGYVLIPCGIFFQKDLVGANSVRA